MAHAVPETIMIPGSFDPPHAGHIDLITHVLDSGMADRVVVVATQNPTKKPRFLSFENTLDLLRLMVPERLHDRIVFETSQRLPLAIAREYGVTALVRGTGRQQIKNPTRERLHEFALATCFYGASMLGLGPHMKIKWIAAPHEKPGLSSTRVRDILKTPDKKRLSELPAFVDARAARLLTNACKRCKAALDVQQGVAEFNAALAKLLPHVQPVSMPASPPGIGNPLTFKKTP